MTNMSSVAVTQYMTLESYIAFVSECEHSIAGKGIIQL